MNIQTPMVFTVTVYQGHHTEGFADLAPLAAAEVERWYMAPGIRRIDVTEDGLTAAILLPPGRTRVCRLGLVELFVSFPRESQRMLVYKGDIVLSCLKDLDLSLVSWTCGVLEEG